MRISDWSSDVCSSDLATIDEIRQIAQDVYGFDPGNFQNLSGNLKPGSKDKLLKIDWNITDNQRASFRYNKTDQTESIFPNLSASGRDISLDSQWHTDSRSLETFVAQLYSDWTDNFSTETKFYYRNFDSVPQVNSNSEERREGKGAVSTCKFRCAT